jgi:hypothetical protein
MPNGDYTPDLTLGAVLRYKGGPIPSKPPTTDAECLTASGIDAYFSSRLD